MLDENSFKELTREIAALGYPERDAAHFAGLIGDTPGIDDQGRVVVIDNGRELTRLRLQFFER